MIRELRSWWTQSLRESLEVVVAVGAGSVAVLGMTLAAARLSGIPLSAVVVDPGASLAEGRLVGVISIAGVVLWSIAASVTLVAASLVTGRDRSFLLAFGLLSAWLAIDDQLMLHDAALVGGIPGGKQAYAVLYGGLVVALAARFRTSIPGRHSLVLVLAVGLLACSVGADVLSDTFGLDGGAERIVEDSLKFMGICYWATFAILRARALVLSQRPLGLGHMSAPVDRGQTSSDGSMSVGSPTPTLERNGPAHVPTSALDGS